MGGGRQEVVSHGGSTVFFLPFVAERSCLSAVTLYHLLFVRMLNNMLTKTIPKSQLTSMHPSHRKEKTNPNSSLLHASPCHLKFNMFAQIS